jgi:carbamoyltransferase
MQLFIGANFFSTHDTSMYIINPSKQDIFAMSTERLTRYKHDYLYPTDVLLKYIETRNLNPDAVDEVFVGLPFAINCIDKISAHYNEKEVLFRKIFNVKYFKDVQNAKKQIKHGNILKNNLKVLSSSDGLQYIKSRFFKNLKLYKMTTCSDEVKRVIKKVFPNAHIQVKCFNHSYAHIISSYYSSPFEDATLITMDGSGDGAFSQAFYHKDGVLHHLSTSKYAERINRTVGTCGSVGEIYSYFTMLLGFQPLADEGKVEALAAYGNYNNEVYQKLMELVTLDTKKHCLVMNEEKAIQFLHKDSIEVYLKNYSKEDISAAVQKFLEDIAIPYFKNVVEKTEIRNICLSGGVAANVIMNLKVFEEITPNIHILPAMGDEGTAEGVAIALMLENGYQKSDIKWIKQKSMPYFGTEYKDEEIYTVLKKRKNITFDYLGNTWHQVVAKLLTKGEIGSLFQGRMEWGPRALGNRSIIALANDETTRVKMNKEIKKRPEFQPFCPSILLDEKERLFVDAYNNKHMTCAFRMKDEYKSDLPSAVHIDGTARVQFVSKKDNENYYKLLQKVKELTGYGVLINTSFNKHGRTIVESPDDALDDFIDTDLNFMMIGGYLVKRAH